MTRKFVHVDGRVPTHRFLEVPVGTPATDLLAAAGRTDGLDENEVILDGGPGWCFEIEASPDRFGVRKRTNCLLVMEESVVEENTLGSSGRVNVLAPAAWKRSVHETEPTETLRPDRVEVPLITNPAFEGIVTPSEPIVRPGDELEAGEMIARPADGISVAHHAPIDGTVVHVDDRSIGIERRDRTAEGATTADADDVFWARCTECGRSLPEPQLAAVEIDGETRGFVCSRCR